MADAKTCLIVFMMLAITTVQSSEDEYGTLDGERVMIRRKRDEGSETKILENLQAKQLDFGEDPMSSVDISSVITQDLYDSAVCLWLKMDQSAFAPVWLYMADGQMQFGLWARHEHPTPFNFNAFLTYDSPIEDGVIDSKWHHMCVNVEWTEDDHHAVTQVFFDGVQLPNKTFENQQGPITPGGVLRLGGSDINFHISGFNIYSKFVEPHTVATLMTCYGIGNGDVFSWETDVLAVPALVKPVDVFIDNNDEVGVICSGCMRYQIFTNEETYDVANQMCIDMGNAVNKQASLAVVSTTGLFDTIRLTILAEYLLERSVKKGYWIGLSDPDSDNDFIWADGTPLDEEGMESAWAPGEPNNKLKVKKGNDYYQDCVQMWRKRDFKFDDDWCYKKKGFICQCPYDCLT